MISSQPDQGDIIILEGKAIDMLNRWMDEVTELLNTEVHKKTIAVGVPGVTNDVTEGYTPFSEWIDTGGPTLFICIDNAKGAAVWQAV